MNQSLTVMVFLATAISAAAAMGQTGGDAGTAGSVAVTPGAPSGNAAAGLAAPPTDQPPPGPALVVPPESPAPPADGMGPPPPPLNARVDVVEARVEGMDESLAVTRSATEKLAKLRLSGYVQSRYERYSDSEDGLNAAGNPGDTDRFVVRRGRLKAEYQGMYAAYELQIDATGDGVVLKQAEATFVDTWTPFRIRLTAGQFKWPFGHEILQSSADREMPERARVIRRLFPGEHDRGLRLRASYGPWRFAGGLVNGNGAQDKIYKDTDQNRFKDLVGRLGAEFEWLSFGVSGYWGRWLETTEPVKFTVATDTNLDGVITVDEITMGATAATYKNFARKRAGADVQFTFDLPELGDLELRGEVIWARDTNQAFRGVAADPCANVTSFGWMVTVVQSFGHSFQAVLRLDSFDPNASGSLRGPAGATCLNNRGNPLGVDDRVTTLGGGLLFHASRNLKATVAYEHPSEQGDAVANDTFTAQLQARF